MFRSAWFMAVLLATAAAPVVPAFAADEPYRLVITSATGHTRTDAKTVLGSEVTPGCPTAWKIEKTTLHGGQQEGVELVTIDNGKLTIVVIPTRGMSVYEVRSGNVRLGWKSPVQEIVHPQHIRLESRGGIGWVSGFNEWMVRCGLEYAGHPGRDEFINNTGAKSEMDLTLHGKIGNIPASEVEVLVDRAAPYRLRLRGVVHERVFFGPKLELATEISTEPGSDTLTIEDRVTNQGSAPQEMQLIYHTNYGRPVLEQGAKIVGPFKKVTPMNDHAAKAVEKWATYQAPTAGFIEEVYLCEPIGDSKGQTRVLLANAAGDAGASIRWSLAELPYFTLWKNTAAEADGYVTGLEPGTGYPYNRKVERKQGRLAKIEAGATRSFKLEFGLHAGQAAVQGVREEIEKLQGGKPPQLERTPPKVD
jgi:hypothetical protein